MSEYRMLAYFGRMISTACPRSSSSRLRPETTSPSPPALAAGAHSGATITTYTAHPPRAARRVPTPRAFPCSHAAARRHRPRRVNDRCTDGCGICRIPYIVRHAPGLARRSPGDCMAHQLAPLTEKPESLTQIVYQTLRDAIISKRLPPG